MSSLTGPIVVSSVVLGTASALALQSPREVPRTWDSALVSTFELPLADPEYSPQHVPEAYYYRLPVRTIYKSYPIYHPRHEPAGYREWLAEQEPEVVFDESGLGSDQDWVDAGALVFVAPIGYNGPVTSGHVRDPAWYEDVGVPLTAEGVMPFARWVVRSKGRPEVGNLACAMCHTRVMPDGTTVAGAQGNFAFDRSIARDLTGSSSEAIRASLRQLTFAPWMLGDPLAGLSKMQLVVALAAVPPGVLIRHGTSPPFPARIPDLIGVKDRAYLDATGLVRHRGIGDLMRYAASNQTVGMLARYGTFIPAGIGQRNRPEPGRGRFVGTRDRYTDVQLYALSMYLYSLEPPPNPHPLDARARGGQAVFERLRCGLCHTPPLYTNNVLLPVAGFNPPPEHRERYDILDVPLGTDPGLTLTTRRGTGYY